MKNKIVSVLTIFILIFIFSINTILYAKDDLFMDGNLYLRSTSSDTCSIVGLSNISTIEEWKVPRVTTNNIKITSISKSETNKGIFRANRVIKKVDLSESMIDYIAESTFQYCNNLTEFYNSECLREIGIYAFQQTNLNSITLYDGLEIIGAYAFEDAFSTKKDRYIINIPDSVKTIRLNAFKAVHKKYKIVLLGKKGSVAEEYCKTDDTCTFMERGDKVPTEEEIIEEEIRKEKSKVFENPKFIHHNSNYNNTDDANIVNYFGGLSAATLSSSNSEEYTDIIRVDDGLIVVGYSCIDKYKYSSYYSEYIQETLVSKAKGYIDAIIVKYNYDLKMEWLKVFGGSLDDKFEKIYKMNDGGYIVFGKTCSRDKDLLNINNDTSNYNSMAVRYDKDFNIISTKMGEYSDIYEENKKQILEDEKGKISEGRFVLDTISDGKTGVNSGINGHEMNSLIIKYDEDGHKEWSKTFDRNSSKTNDRLTKAVEVDDGYVFIGISCITNMSNTKVLNEDAIIVKYKPPYDQIMIMDALPYKIDVEQEKKLELYYVPWEDVTIGEMNWTSDNKEIAIVDYKGNVIGKSEGETTIHLSIRGKTAIVSVKINDPTLKHIEDITLNKTEITIEKGRTETLVATILPTDTKDSKTINWTSNNTDVATVSEDGTVTGISEGIARITATTSNGITARCKINVINPKKPKVSSIVLNKETMEIGKGKEEKLTATVNPVDAENKQIEWISSNPNIATVSKDGTVTGRLEGKATIIATAKDGSGVSAACEVSVTFVIGTRIELNEYYQTLEIGETYKLIATVKPENATNKEVLWSSSDPNIATIDENGVITAVSAGNVEITAISKDYYGVVAHCNIKVVIRAKNITLDKTELNLQKGETAILTARIEPSNTTEREIKWKSDDPNVVKVNERGYIETVSAGTATITAVTSNGKTATCMVTVTSVTTPVKPTPTTILGDVDGNNKITTKDAKIVLQHIVKKITLTNEQFKSADADKNGKITTKDAKMILQHIVKKIELPLE